MNKVIIWNYLPIAYSYYPNYTSGTVIYPTTIEMDIDKDFIIL